MKATTALRKIIHEHSPLNFAEYMNLCLYHPEYGYYAREPRQVGREGDFFTSVSCGPLFGILIAEKIAEWWRASTISGAWRIIEPGPNNGDLARDVLTHLQQHHADVAAELTYVTIDPLPAPRAYQQQALASFGEKVLCLADAKNLPALPTFVIANEVLDAFPCGIIQRFENEWREVWIDSPSPEAALEEIFQPFSGELPASLRHGDYPLGYRTELRNPAQPFFTSLLGSMSQGRMLFFDYGFAATEYYDPQRTQGTLRVYRDHSASENPLLDPGLCDLTAHVDFTSILACAQSLEMSILRFEPQEFFLSRLMMPLVERGQWKASWQNNFQTLTHPSHLGGKFHAFELSFGEGETNDGTALRRLIH